MAMGATVTVAMGGGAGGVDGGGVNVAQVDGVVAEGVAVYAVVAEACAVIGVVVCGGGAWSSLLLRVGGTAVVAADGGVMALSALTSGL